MTNRNAGSHWLGAVAFFAGVMVTGCSGATTENTTTAVSQAVQSASDSTDAAEVANLMRGLHQPRSEAVEGFHCDSSPDITYVDVCGKSLPATVHLEWTNCAAPEGRGGHGDRGAPPSGSTSSTGTTPTGAAGTATSSGSTSSTSGMPNGCDGGGGHGGEGAMHGPSSGTVDITNTYDGGDCTAAVTQNQSVTFQITRTGQDGSVASEQGTTTSTAQLIDNAPPQKKQTSADVTRKLTDASGTVVKSVHLTGSMSTEFSSDTPPTRTINGSYTEEFLDGTTGNVTLASIVRPPRSVCAWPTAGTLTRASSDGTSHTLAFGPDCGTATLDGTAIQLTGLGGPGKGRH